MSTDHFDERAATWDDDPAKVERATAVAAAITDAIDIAPGTTLLEVGAGTGLVATALRPHVGAITLSDPSVGMRTVMLGKSADPEHPLSGARILDLDLAERSDAKPAIADRFGLVVAVLVLHHVPDIDHALATLVNHSEDGGHVAVVDLETEDGSF
ncbi:MAG: methyltransferase domain-containing protein, partial [Nitriliruptoraceae bacterium]